MIGFFWLLFDLGQRERKYDQNGIERRQQIKNTVWKKKENCEKNLGDDDVVEKNEVKKREDLKWKERERKS